MPHVTESAGYCAPGARNTRGDNDNFVNHEILVADLLRGMWLWRYTFDLNHSGCGVLFRIDRGNRRCGCSIQGSSDVRRR